MSSPYERGRRGGHHGFGGRDRERDRDHDRNRNRDYERNDSRDRKRPRDESQGRRPGPSRGKFQKRGGRGRGSGRGRGRGGRTEEPEFRNVIVTRPETATQKSAFEAEDENLKGLIANDKKLVLHTNYFRVARKVLQSVTMYRIDFDPPTENKYLRISLIRQTSRLLGAHVYDGANAVYLINKLEEKEVRVPVEIKDPRSGELQTFKVKFREASEVLYTDANFLSVFNLIIRSCCEALGLNKIGRNYYDPTATQYIRELKVDIMPGFITSIRQHENDLLLCVESASKFVRNENIWKTIQDLARSARGAYQADAERQLIGSTVITTYNNKKYRIDEIDWKHTVGKSFFKINDQEKSYAQYYKERYNIQELDPNQPLLISKAKAKDIRGGASPMISLIPQLCQPTGVTDSMRHNFQMMRQLAQMTRKTPADRVKLLLDFNKRIQGNEQCKKIMNDNKIDIDTQLVALNARQMEAEKVYFGKNQIVPLHASGPDVADWTKSLKDHTMLKCKKLDRWVFMCPRRGIQDAQNFLDKLIESGIKLGMEITDKYRVEELSDDRIDTYVHALRSVLERDPSFIVVVVDSNREDKYSAIKKTCYLSRSPVAIQVLCMRTITDSRRGLMSVANKVAIQINCKLGGIPWLIRIPLTGLLVIGFDVTHDTNDKRKSFGAMVAQMVPPYREQDEEGNILVSKEAGKFWVCANSHTDGQQISNYLGVNVITTAQKYKDLYGTLPKKIIIYRDGVGDGQIEYVHKFEVKDIVSKLNRLYGYDHRDPDADPQREPQLGFIIVNKRINTRFFAKTQKGFDNPLPGTVVDSVVTLPERYDFYLISQSVTQGTVSPTAYNIIHDNLKLPPAHIQRLTYKLCHNYYNWSGTTRVPSVVQYAKKFALLIGQHLHQDPTGFDIDRMMYFL